MSVYKNMAFGLRMRKMPKDEIDEKVREAARILDIEELLERKPKALSGGQRQRVALGRAMVRDPAVFLLDEPLSNLDAKLRTSMRTELTKLHKRLGTTFVYVTHDQIEAMTMADRIVVMHDGFIQQVDTPQNLYDRPQNLFVAGFIGTPPMNFLESVIVKVGERYVARVGDADLPLLPDRLSYDKVVPYEGKDVVVGVRPENLHLDPAYLNLPTTGVLDAGVDLAELMGSEIYVYARSGETSFIAKVPPQLGVESGAKIKVAVDCNKTHLFDKETQHVIV